MLTKIAIIIAIILIGGTLMVNPDVDAVPGEQGQPFEALLNAIEDLQNRVTGTCPANSSIRIINADGSVECEFDSDTTYSGTSPITVDGTTISLSDTGCASGEVLGWNGASWECVQPVSSLGYQRVSGSFNVLAFTTSTGNIFCPTGTNVVGGGYSGVNFGNSVMESFPFSETTWAVTVFNSSFSTDTVSIYVLCIDNTP